MGSFKVQRLSVLPQGVFFAGFSWIYSAQVCSPQLFAYGGSDGKEAACDMGGASLIPGSGRSPGEGNGYPLQCFCLENSMDRGVWRVTVHGIAKSQT